MLKPRILLLLMSFILLLAWFSSTGIWKGTSPAVVSSPPARHEITNEALARRDEMARKAKAFVQQNNFNETICFLADMSLPSGQNRFFIYNLEKDSLLNAGLVTHGRCNEGWLEGRRYGNTVGCGCTSLGKYKIGYSYHGRFGLAFKLYGLDKTNNNAFARFVVLHSHECVPEAEVSDDICQSDGCPTVSPGFLQQLKPVITSSKKPLLLWIYE